MTPRTVLILCDRAPVKTNPVPAVRYSRPTPLTADEPYERIWLCSYCGRRVQVVA